MRQMMVCAALWLVSAPAFANKICVVDFQTAVNETSEGRSAKSKLDSMANSRRGQVDKMQQDFEKKVQDYQNRRSIMSADAVSQEEQKLALEQQQLQQTAIKFEEEFQRKYMELLSELEQKMRTVAAETAKASSCSIVIDKAAVVYQANNVTDISSSLVSRYNKAHPGK